MVSTNSTPPIAMPVQVPPGHVVQQIVDESGTLRHVILSPQAMMPMSPHFVGPGPGTSSNQPPQTFYAPQGLPAGYPPPPFGHANPLQPGVMAHVPPPTQQGHSSPPLNFHKDERTQRQYFKLKKKLEQKHMRGGDGFSISSSQGTPPTSPRKELVNGIRRSKEQGMSSVGTSEDGEESSSIQDEEEETNMMIVEMLSTAKSPQVTELKPRSALLMWSQPDIEATLEGKSSDFDISESEFRYEVLLGDKGKEGKYKSIYNGPHLSCRVQDLRPGTEYSVCLQVHLDELQGSASEPTVFVTPPCEPDQPLPPKLFSRSRTNLQLRWNAPVDNGSHITQYVLECDEGKGNGFVEVYKNKGKQHNLMKLQASTCYRFRLAAVNDCGKSLYSDVIQFSTSGSPPNQPSPPVLKEASVNSLHLAWQRRPNDEDFTLQMEDLESGHGFLPIYNGKEQHYIREGLRRHTEYKFRLRANNEEGASRWSEEVCYRTLPDRPAAPPRPSVKGRVHAHAFKMKWEPPSDRGGADITTYILELNSGSGFETIYTGPDTECVCDRLVPGTTYQVRVSCISAGGRSDCSDLCTVITEAVCPSKCSPPRLHGKPRATSLSLKWGYPEYDGGAPLTEFEVIMKCPDSSLRVVHKGKETECTVLDLSPGQDYVFQVRAYNRVGAGPWSEVLEVLSGAAPPACPGSLQVTCRSPHSALVQWEEPISNGAPITDYRLEMCTTDKEQDYVTVFHGLATSHEVKGLLAATPYFFRIQASNSVGWSPLSAPSLGLTPPSSPAAISQLRYSATPTSLTLSWQEPACHGADILHYSIDVGERVECTEGPELEHTVHNLQPMTTYRCRVQAVNCVGPGPFSPVLRASTLPLPPAPPRLECVGIGHNYLKLKWGDGKNPDFTQYTVEMENHSSKDFYTVYHGTSHSCKVNRLHELTRYRFRIAAANDTGQGESSEPQEFSTCIAPPPSLKAPKVSDVHLRSCTVEWSPCKPSWTDPIIYQVQLARLRDQEYKQVYRGSETKVQLHDLDPGTEYNVRVCPIRQTNSGDLPGAYSTPGVFTTTAPEPVMTSSPKTVSTQIVETKSMTDQHLAIIIVIGFSFVGILIAVAMQQFIHWSKSSP
ncbi:fibronectin type-III domain-containing protein 3A isoform X2 [Anabrus simplex]